MRKTKKTDSENILRSAARPAETAGGKPSVLAFGAVVWDVIDGKEFIGGAPFNASVHLARLGTDVTFLSSVGKDRLGDLARKRAEELGLSAAAIARVEGHGTGCAYCTIGKDGSATYTFSPEPAFLFVEPPKGGKREFDAFYFGLWEQSGEVSRATVKAILDSCRFRTVFLDVNIRNDFYPADVLKFSLEKSDVVKMNDEEAERIAVRLYGAFDGIEATARRLAGDFGLRLVCVTKGAKGHELFAPSFSSAMPAEKIAVEDTIGAGDAFCAGFLACYLKTGDLDRAGRAAELLGGYVASRRSALPDYDEALTKKLNALFLGARPEK